MIIRINKDKKVIACIYNPAEGFVADGVNTFEVPTIPEKEENTFLCFDPETMMFFEQEVDPAVMEERKARAEAQEKKAAAMKWLADNDWKVNKRMLGEWAENDERWLAYLDGRAKARAEYDEAEAVLNG